MLILGSSSPIRAAMLRDAGIDFSVGASAFDEDAVKAGFEKTADRLALELARGKALGVEAGAGDLVIGGDSVLEVEGKRFDKPRDKRQAADHLRSFSGRTMVLHSAVALARDGDIVWDLVDTAHLRVRDLNEDFIESMPDPAAFRLCRRHPPVGPLGRSLLPPVARSLRRAGPCHHR